MTDPTEDPAVETSGDRRDPAAVRRTYDRIADHFAATRANPWPEVREFVEGARRGDVGLDLGSGNARHAELLADRVERTLCLDLSVNLLGIARERMAAGETPGQNVDFLQADAAALPVGAAAVDLALYVATIHHLPTREARIRSLDELARVLSSGGRVLVSAWSTTHDRFDREEGFDTTVEWTLPGGETVDRFYHIYDPDEFSADLAASRLTVHSNGVSSGNCFAECGPPRRDD